MTELPSHEHERLALVALFAASQASDAEQRRHHLDQAAIHAAAAERVRADEASPRRSLFSAEDGEDGRS